MIRALSALAVGGILGGRLADAPPTASVPPSTRRIASPTPLDVATARPSRSAIDVGGPGSVVVARVDQTSVLTIVSVAADGTERVVGEPRPLDGLAPPYVWDDGQIWLGDDGIVLLEAYADRDDLTTNRLLRIDWPDPAEAVSILPQGRPFFLAGGVLVIVDGTNGPASALAIDAEHPTGALLPVPPTVGLFGTTADGAGAHDRGAR